MSNSVKFYITVVELLIFAIALLYFNVIVVDNPQNILFFTIINIIPTLSMKYLSVFIFILLYGSVKVHKLIKCDDYATLVQRVKKLKNKGNYENAPQEEKFFQEYLEYYVWMTNKDCQKGLNAFAIGGLLISAVWLLDIPDSLIFVAYGFFFWGLIKFCKGTIEVV